MKFIIINGPNINMLGVREKDVYGSRTYQDLVKYLEGICAEKGVEAEIYQSNHEGCLVDKIQEVYGKADGIIINPAAYTHTSIAILDALKAVSLPTVEVHLSDISKREDFRKLSYAGMACLKTFAGFGFEGYQMAVDFLYDYLQSQSSAG